MANGTYIEPDRRQTTRRQCDEHRECVVKFQAAVDAINEKIDILCTGFETLPKINGRITAIEHAVSTHNEKIESEIKWRGEHELFKDKSLEKQAVKDKAMDDKINDLQLAVTELTTTIVKTESTMRNYLDDKISAFSDKWTKPIIAAAGVLGLTCLTGIGALVMSWIVFLANRGS